MLKKRRMKITRLAYHTVRHDCPSILVRDSIRFGLVDSVFVEMFFTVCVQLSVQLSVGCA